MVRIHPTPTYHLHPSNLLMSLTHSLVFPPIQNNNSHDEQEEEE